METTSYEELLKTWIQRRKRKKEKGERMELVELVKFLHGLEEVGTIHLKQDIEVDVDDPDWETKEMPDETHISFTFTPKE